MSTIVQIIDDPRSCAEMLEDEERVKKMLRRAVRTEVASPALRAKIQERIRAKHTFNFFPLTIRTGGDCGVPSRRSRSRRVDRWRII